MSTVLTKKQMTEEDIKLQYITPAIISKWDVRKITMETQVTDGKINLKGNFVFREKPKRADYILYMSANNPIAVIEAKDNKHSISHGLQQAMTYAQMLDLPFAYSSNGDGFAEHDFLTGKERVIGLDEFPSESELIERFKQESGMTSAQEAIIQQPYYSSQNTYPPRYYQRIAINRTVDNFIRQWSQEEKKEKIKEMLLERGINLETMKKEQNMVDVDDFDFICHVAFDKKPLTRKERANNVKKRDFLSKYSGIARDVLEALLDKYMNTGIYEIEKTEILKLDPFLKLGKPAKIAGYFGGKAGYMQAVKELEKAIYTEEAV